MKKIIIVALLALVTHAASWAGALDSDSTRVYSEPKAEEYFSGGQVADGLLILQAQPAFSTLAANEKAAVLKPMLQSMGAVRALVQTASASELWLTVDNSLSLAQTFDGKFSISDYNYKEVDRLGPDKWYASFGGNLNLVGDMCSASFNGRLGTFLYKYIIDLSLGLNLGVSDSGEYDSDFDLGVDLMSRFYFTRILKMRKVSPFVGFGVGYIICPHSSVEPIGSVGANIYLPKGSIDVSLQYGKTSKFGFNVGYTITF